MPPVALDLSSLPGGPAPGSLLCHVSDIENGAAKLLTFGSGVERYDIFLQRSGDQVFAYVNSCPHARHPLDWQPGRFLDRTGTLIQCASHGARFRMEDGLCVAGPCLGKYLRSVALVVEGGAVFVPGPLPA
jgi:nitrite reductase/ring-hydroxylating ferredoxin subunit